MSDFVVNDHRLFDKEGNKLSEDAKAKAVLENNPVKDQQKEDEDAGAQYLANLPASLPTLIVGLATSALIQMGEQPLDANTPASPPDLRAAKHTIDLLAVLQEKTKGNLEQEEEALLSTFLYDLRMKYVAVTTKK